MREMSAVVITRPGGPEVLELGSVPLPEPARSQIRVRVHASALNRADLLQRRGRYPAPPGWPTDVPGLEYAGVVERVGAGVEAWTEGDRVMGLVGGGAYAEYVVVHEREAVRIPDRLDFEEAGAIPEVFITAHDALFSQLGLAAGETLLIHAVGSGVGTAALQLARSAGATVIGTSRSAWKLERAGELGLDHAIDSSREQVVERVRSITEGRGVDVVLDLVGGPLLAANLESLALKGRMIVVGVSGGRSADIDLGQVLRKRLTLVGTALRARPLEEKIQAAQAFAARVVGRFAAGTLRPVIDRSFPLHEAAKAHQRMEENANFGKIVLAVPEDP